MPTDRQQSEFRSRQCKGREHNQCDGYYDTGGSAFGYDTYLCHCQCHDEKRGTGP